MKTVLVIDDDVETLNVIQAKLEAHQVKVITGTDGYQALQLARQRQPDLIIMDVVMPKLSGFKAARLIKFDAKTRGIPLILLTVMNQEMDKKFGKEVGAAVHMVKPFDPEYLLKEVQRLLGLALVLFFLLTAAPVAFADYGEGIEAYRKAWAAYSSQRFGEAKVYADKAVRADPQQAHAHALLGDLAYLRHDLTAAKSAWAKALEVNPQLTDLEGQIAQAEAEMALEKQLLVISHWPLANGQQPIANGSLVIRLPKDLPAQEQQAIVATLARAMDGLEPYFQYRVNRSLTVLVYPRETFHQMNHVPTEVLGLFDGKIRMPERPFAVSHSLLANSQQPTANSSVIWHEYAHAVVYDLTHGQAPRWLQEGLAQECELFAIDHSPLAKSQQPIANGPSRISLKALMGISERYGEPITMRVSQFYSASHSLVRLLLETWGWDRMRAFLKSLGAGRTVEEGLEGVYGLDLKRLESKWLESM